MSLLTQNIKLMKGDKFLVYGLQLAPSNISGHNVCPSATQGCIAGCLYYAGMGAMPNVMKARIEKTQALFADRADFINQVKLEITKLERKAAKQGLELAIRLNTLGDLPWEKWGIMEQFPNVQFYDYTKVATKAIKWARGEMPQNYHLTFSRAESNDLDVAVVLQAGGNVAAVFAGDLPETWKGRKVIDGDKNDYRWTDPKGCIVGLKAKGRARKDCSGFVIR